MTDLSTVDGVLTSTPRLTVIPKSTLLSGGIKGKRRQLRRRFREKVQAEGVNQDALQPLVEQVQRSEFIPHFGTTAVTDAINAITNLDAVIAGSPTAETIKETIENVSRLRDGLIPIPQEGGLSPHFGSHAFMNAIEDIKNWIGDGMDVQALLPMLSEAREAISRIPSAPTSEAALTSLLESISKVESVLNGHNITQITGPSVPVVLLSFASIFAAWSLLTVSATDVLEESKVPKLYSAEANEEYLSKQQLVVAKRMAKVASSAAVFLAAVRLDKELGRDKEMEPQRAVQLRNIIEDLGPTFVKVAQALSTRVDILTPAYFKEIERLQDKVATFDDGIAYESIKTELGKSVGEVFERLSPSPVASASLGQVYRGKLKEKYGGGEVAVKVQRPNVLCQVALDLYVMRFLAGTVVKSWQSSQTDYPGLLDEWAVRFFQEMDYEQETRNAIQFRKDMESLDGIVVPEFYPELCSRKVLVSEWIEGEKLNESSAPDVRELCNTLMNAYLIQLLDTGFLHADPHPGNLIRTPEGKICIVDFGLMTYVSKEQRDNLVDYIAKLTTEDWEGVARALAGLGFIPEGAPDPVESGLVEPLGAVFSQLVKGGGAQDMAKRLKANTNIDQVRQQLEDLSEDYPFTIPTFFTLVLRAFSVIEGIALRVDPQFSIVMSCFPYMSKRLLTDNSPRMNNILKGMLYGKKQRLDVERLERMSNGLQSFTVDGLQKTKSPTQKGSALSDSTVREAILVLFAADGSYLQELLVDEMVAAVDAMSKEALSQVFATFLGSAPVAAAIRTMDALGPLRPFVFPLLTPAEVVQRLAPAVATTAEDEEALLMVKGILRLVQQMDATAQSLPSPELLARNVEEISPLLPQLLPGTARIGEQFVRRLISRIMTRTANVLDPTGYNSGFEESMQALD